MHGSLSGTPTIKVNRRLPAPKPAQEVRCAIKGFETANMAALGLQCTPRQTITDQDHKRVLLSHNLNIHLCTDPKHLPQRLTLNKAFGCHLRLPATCSP